MPPLQRDHSINGPYTLKGGELTFRTASGRLADDARTALKAGRGLAVSVTLPGGIRELEGKVLSVGLLEHGRPVQWEIVIQVRD